ncbi:hypothetical protein ACFQX6_63190 [Streptosporangium lutulentum]
MGDAVAGGAPGDSPPAAGAAGAVGGLDVLPCDQHRRSEDACRRLPDRWFGQAAWQVECE